MSIYIIVAILSSFLMQIAAMTYDKNKLAFIISFALFILFPSVIEGCRDWYVGEDMLSYGSYGFYNSLHYNDVFTYLRNETNKEQGFYILCYFCGKVGPINFYMFIVALIKMILLGITCIHFRKISIIWLAVLGYMLIFYWYGFSLMRQTLALCICLYSTIFLQKKKYISFFICIIIAYFFHNSAVFFVMLPLIMFISKLKKRLSLVIIGAILVYLAATVLFVFIATSGLFGEEMLERYENSGVESSKTLLLITITFIITSMFHSDDKTIKFYVQAFSIIILMLLSLASNFAASFRVAFYFIIPMLFFITWFIESIKNPLHKFIVSFCFVFVYFLHIIIAASHGMGGAYPYKSIILDSFL